MTSPGRGRVTLSGASSTPTVIPSGGLFVSRPTTRPAGTPAPGVPAELLDDLDDPANIHDGVVVHERHDRPARQPIHLG